ncbi:MAG TPA: AraC family transcriptional regulator [Mobilitalea sp.]|nr:AraC family transcriptional regulator [Mobilitalea sp.]
MDNQKNFFFHIEGVGIHILMVSYRRFLRVLPAHSHGENTYEIHYISDGYGTVLLNTKKYKVEPEVLFITGPGILHEQIPDNNNPMIEFGLYMHIQEGKPGGEIIQAFRANPMWFGKGNALTRHIMTQILKEMEWKPMGSTETIPLLLAQFLIESARCFNRKHSESQILPEPLGNFDTHSMKEENALLVIDEMFLYDYNDITLEKLSVRLGFSVRQTQRLLNKIYGKSFQEKKMEARMSAAATLLQNSPMNITVISEQLGYSSVEHFSSAFSKHFGMSPTKYRRKS